MVNTTKKNIIIISIALTLSVGGALVYYYLLPRLVNVKKPFDPKTRKKIEDMEMI
jgi:hypothetical protein